MITNFSFELISYKLDIALILDVKRNVLPLLTLF